MFTRRRMAHESLFDTILTFPGSDANGGPPDAAKHICLLVIGLQGGEADHPQDALQVPSQ